MKNRNLILSVVFLFVLGLPIKAQDTGKGLIITQERSVSNFHSLNAHGAQDIILKQGDAYKVVIETHENLMPNIQLNVQNNTLDIKVSKIKKFDEMTFYVTCPEYKKITASGAAEVKSADQLSGTSLSLSAKGASEMKLDLNYKSVVAHASGASEMKLSGTATSLVADVSGASELKAGDLKTVTTVAKASGASECLVNASTNLTYQVSGASEVKYVEKPENVIIESKSGTEKVVITGSTNKVTTHISHYGDDDTTRVNIGSLDVEVIDGDTTRVRVGSRMLIVTEDGDVKWQRCKPVRFNGHWGGVEIGINGYVTPQFNTNWADEYDYLNLRYEKSTAVNLNIYEQNIALNKDKNIGLITGIGMSWNNYRFTNKTQLTPDSSSIQGYYMKDVSVRKTKLTAMYITVPLFIEFQTKHTKRSRRFHLALGATLGARVSTHTKIYFNDANKSYSLVDPATGNDLPGVYVTPNASSRNIVKNFNSFHLAPFRLDAGLRFGYGIINLFFNYSVNTMFQDNRGPELYPWSAGITLLGW